MFNDIEEYAKYVMDNLNFDEKMKFHILHRGLYDHDFLSDNQLIKSNRDVAEWLVTYDGWNLIYVGQFRDDPEIVRKAVVKCSIASLHIGGKLASDSMFITQIMKEFPKASFGALIRAHPSVQSDPELVQMYLESNLTLCSSNESLRDLEKRRRLANNFFAPECEAILDELLDRHEYYEICGIPFAQAFTMMRLERTSIMKAEIVPADLPVLD